MPDTSARAATVVPVGGRMLVCSSVVNSDRVSSLRALCAADRDIIETSQRVTLIYGTTPSRGLL